MSEKALRRTVRHAKKRNRLGHDANCGGCGRKDLWALRKVGERILCAECHSRQLGKSTYEFHHLGGEANGDFKILIPVIYHMWLSDAQYDWPIQTLRNENNDPLLKMSAMVRGSHDVFTFMENLMPEIAEEMERLSTYWAEINGGSWISDYQQWKDQNDE